MMQNETLSTQLKTQISAGYTVSKIHPDVKGGTTDKKLVSEKL